jgi:hypothetical protein
MEQHVSKIFEAVFECTLQMITRNFEDFPDHRLKFFGLLRAITNHCFSCLYSMTPVQLKLVHTTQTSHFHTRVLRHKCDFISLPVHSGECQFALCYRCR